VGKRRISAQAQHSNGLDRGRYRESRCSHCGKTIVLFFLRSNRWEHFVEPAGHEAQPVS
jgi:hypothetical protein